MLSLPKILLVLVVIGAVVYGTRLLGKARKTVLGDDEKDTPRAGEDSAVDLTKCDACGDFVDPAAGGCGRADCPYA